MPLRIPNPGSDMRRLIEIYRILHKGTAGVEQFDLDDVGRILTSAKQASSRGAVGAAALARSKTVDRSRDPIFNQSKMYSELFRMLGWLRPVNGSRQVFRNTILGDQLAVEFAASPALANGLFRESLLGICFPNPLTDNIGIRNQRPVSWLLRLMARLDGVITRHEMIIGLLAVVDDQAPNALELAAGAVSSVRGERAKLMSAVGEEAQRASVTVVTLENYTRFPVGVMKSDQIGWSRKQRLVGIYERPVEALVLTQSGQAAARWAAEAIDVRESSLALYSIAERAAFATRSFCGMLLRAGLARHYLADQLAVAEAASRPILQGLSLPEPEHVLYSPVQQASDEVLDLAQSS